MLLALPPAVVLAIGPANAAEPRHEITAHLDPVGRALIVDDTITMEGGGRVSVHLDPRMILSRVEVDGREVSSRAPLDLGQSGSHTVRFQYEAALPPFPEEGRRDGYTPLAAGPEGAFLSAGVEWLPRIDARSFQFRLTVETPRPYKAVTIGRLVSETPVANGQRTVFESEHPANEVVLMAGEWTVTERRHKGVLLRTWFPAELEPLAAEYLDSVAGYLDFYQPRIGAYPFSAFHVVAGPLPVGLGYPGLTYMGTQVLRLPFIRATSLGHEVLHDWWGNGVLVDYESGNWSEGLTTYMADYAFAQRQGQEQAREMRLAWLRDYSALPPERDQPVSAFVSKVHDASQVVGYHKVAFIFHMLRQDLGDKAFDAGIRRFWADWKSRTASWSDLRQAFETAAGRDLGGFFEQWLQRIGAPRLILGDARILADGANDKPGKVGFTLSQENPPYALRIPVVVETAAGRQRAVVSLDSSGRAFELEVKGRPVSLAIDPDFDLFRRLDPMEAPPILRDVTLGQDTATLVATNGAEAREAALSVAEAMLDEAPRFVGRDAGSGALLLVGIDQEVKATLQRYDLPPPPEALEGRGSARVWVTRTASGRPVLVVQARDAASLDALRRLLPHYGRQSFLIFEGEKVTERGVWPLLGGPLRADLN